MTEKKIITDFQKMTEIDVSKRIQQKESSIIYRGPMLTNL